MTQSRIVFNVAHRAPRTFSITISAPLAIYELLRVSLCGWVIHPEKASNDLMIDVRDTGKLQVHAPSFVGARQHSDLINTLNDVFIALAYCVRDAKPECDLLHGAALKNESGFNLYFGQAKSGKSRHIAEACVTDGICIADDLLLYCRKSGLFESLGLPPRLRRPLSGAILEKIDASKLLVGHSLCYFTPDMCNMMPAGQLFSPDRLFELDHGYQLLEHPLSALDQFTTKHRIT